MTMATRPRVWITYAWVDDQQGDFQFLVQELAAAGVEATYDRIALTPGRDLWDQIGRQITEGHIDGWAYLVTPNSIASGACREELAYALSRALETKGRDFPLIGLLHGVRVRDLPPALRVRLCVSLADPDWHEHLRAGLEARAPSLRAAPQSRYVWRVHENYLNEEGSVAVEVRPRFGELMFWRFAVSCDAARKTWGSGPAGGHAPSGISFQAIDGARGEIEGRKVVWFGAGDRLSPGVSAYAVFEGVLPRFVAFGTACDPLGLPSEVEILRFPGQ